MAQVLIPHNQEVISISEALESLLWGSYPLAIWRLPHQSEFQLIIADCTEIRIENINLQTLPEGFLMVPFESTDTDPALFIPSKGLCTFTDFRNASPLSLSYYLAHSKKNLFESSKIQATVNETKADFLAQVKAAISAISSGNLEKVVLSRKSTSEAPANFNALEHYQKICSKYPELFCTFLYLPSKNSVWIGASPEILIKQSPGNFETMALAGTQAALNNGNLIQNSEALWRQKEIEEQALVSRYIINCFKKIRVREFTEIGPKTVKAGNLLHLQTRFKVDTNEINFPQLGSVMLQLLHPTSAVCGMPKEAATQFIRSSETHSRSFYSGFLGPVNICQETHLFVNLRSLRLRNGKVTRFAGCGITQDSDPEKEWLETEMKLNTILPHTY